MSIANKVDALLKKITEIEIRTNWNKLDIYYYIMNRSDLYSFEYQLLQEFVNDEKEEGLK